MITKSRAPPWLGCGTLQSAPPPQDYPMAARKTLSKAVNVKGKKVGQRIQLSCDSDMCLCWRRRRKRWSTQVKWAKSLDTIMYQLPHQQSEAVRWKYILPLCHMHSPVTGGCSAVSNGFLSVRATMHKLNSSIILTAKEK